MPLILPGNVGSATAATGYDVANSVRMDAASSSKMAIDFSGAGNQKKFTISCWVKRATITPDNSQTILSNYADVNNFCNFTLNTSDKLSFVNRDGGTFNTNVATTRLFRDPSAFYHVVLSVDTGQGTDTNRIKMYVNGVQETSFSTATYPDQDTDLKFNTTATTNFGSWSGSAQYADGYYSELCFINNAQLAADQFGEFNSDSPNIWQPIDVSGLTFGTNGFYLDFEDSSALGNDVSGNNNDFSVTNLAATDQTTDTCTNNFATLNPLDNYWAGATLSEGNLLRASATFAGSSTGQVSPSVSTIGVSSGKWYSEVKFVSTAEHNYGRVGVTSNQTGPGDGTASIGSLPGSYGYFFNSGDYYNGNGSTAVSYGSTTDVGDIIGIYLDLDNNKLYFSDNGSLVSATGISITDPASTNLGAYFFGAGDESRNTSTAGFNFGGCSAFAISSGNTDDNGYGNFEFSPNITGDGAAKKFYSLCTKNLAEFG